MIEMAVTYRDSRCNLSKMLRQLDIPWMTHVEMLMMYPEYKNLIRLADEEIIDKAQQVIHDKLDDGDAKVAMWVLDRLGADRGYTERKQVTLDEVPEISFTEIV